MHHSTPERCCLRVDTQRSDSQSRARQIPAGETTFFLDEVASESSLEGYLGFHEDGRSRQRVQHEERYGAGIHNEPLGISLHLDIGDLNRSLYTQMHGGLNSHSDN